MIKKNVVCFLLFIVKVYAGDLYDASIKEKNYRISAKYEDFETLFKTNNALVLLSDQTRTFLLQCELFPPRSICLKGNMYLCDCANKRQNQEMDYDEIICNDTGSPIKYVTSYEVFQIGRSGILFVFLLTAMFLLWRFRLQLKIYLFSRGLCLFCSRDEDLDADRPYDVFLSFAHGDGEYVMQHLLPKLEGEPDFYHVCVHYPDWIVGDRITTQIMRSVEASKRTVIVLSRNFLASMWGSLEFRYAVASRCQHGRSRLLVLILDDVLTQELGEEIQGYLSFNTYLRCDDPLFWEKLRQSLHLKTSVHLKDMSCDDIPITTSSGSKLYNDAEPGQVHFTLNQFSQLLDKKLDSMLDHKRKTITAELKEEFAHAIEDIKSDVVHFTSAINTKLNDVSSSLTIVQKKSGGARKGE